MNKNYINKKVSEILILASKKYERTFPEIKINFDLKGQSVGMFCFGINNKRFRFNLGIFDLNQDNFDQTIIHECAHYVVHEIYNYKNKRIKPHGYEWKNAMIVLGGKLQRCHHLEMPKLTKKRQDKFEFKCSCQTHHVSKLINKRIRLFGRIYTCKKCRKKLRFVE